MCVCCRSLTSDEWIGSGCFQMQVTGALAPRFQASMHAATLSLSHSHSIRYPPPLIQRTSGSSLSLPLSLTSTFATSRSAALLTLGAHGSPQHALPRWIAPSRRAFRSFRNRKLLPRRIARPRPSTMRCIPTPAPTRVIRASLRRVCCRGCAQRYNWAQLANPPPHAQTQLPRSSQPSSILHPAAQVAPPRRAPHTCAGAQACSPPSRRARAVP